MGVDKIKKKSLFLSIKHKGGFEVIMKLRTNHKTLNCGHCFSSCYFHSIL